MIDMKSLIPLALVVYDLSMNVIFLFIARRNWMAFKSHSVAHWCTIAIILLTAILFTCHFYKLKLLSRSEATTVLAMSLAASAVHGYIIYIVTYNQ